MTPKAKSFTTTDKQSLLPILLLGFMIVLSTTSRAQITRGSLSGNVADPTGAILPNANVQLRNPANGEEIQTITNAEGEFNLPSLAIGNYALTVEATGFKRFVIQTGTNQLHGGVFWYHRNSVLNANSFINNATNTPRPFSLQNRVGVIANGPLYLPKPIFGPASYDGRNRSLKRLPMCSRASMNPFICSRLN